MELLCLASSLLGRNKGVLVDGLDHVLKLDPSRPGPAVVDDWLSRSFPAVHWVYLKHTETITLLSITVFPLK